MSNQISDVEFLKDETLWPNIVCPVKRYPPGKSMECGIVADDNEPVVRILNMFAGWTPESFDAAVKYTYPSFEAMIEDGWMVD